jgi:hypothetical protein
MAHRAKRPGLVRLIVLLAAVGAATILVRGSPPREQICWLSQHREKVAFQLFPKRKLTAPLDPWRIAGASLFLLYGFASRTLGPPRCHA